MDRNYAPLAGNLSHWPDEPPGPDGWVTFRLGFPEAEDDGWTSSYITGSSGAEVEESAAVQVSVSGNQSVSLDDEEMVDEFVV